MAAGQQPRRMDACVIKDAASGSCTMAPRACVAAVYFSLHRILLLDGSGWRNARIACNHTVHNVPAGSPFCTLVQAQGILYAMQLPCQTPCSGVCIFALCGGRTFKAWLFQGATFEVACLCTWLTVLVLSLWVHLCRLLDQIWHCCADGRRPAAVGGVRDPPGSRNLWPSSPQPHSSGQAGLQQH